MVRLDAVFKRYPKLTNKQRKVLARRRVERALQSIPFHSRYPQGSTCGGLSVISRFELLPFNVSMGGASPPTQINRR